ncbi:MAG: hypothetical protein JWO31_3719 [Phycisphaerales bacterium]|nr:hypothetical protein [Phycisphaerales bacterium]
MSVSSVSSSASSAVHYRRRSTASANSSSSSTSSLAAMISGGQAADATGGTQSSSQPPGPPPEGGPGGGQGPGGGGGMAKFEDILKSGGGVAELKAEADKQFDAFKSSDAFASMSTDEQQAVQDRHDSGDEDERLQGMVDQYAKTGSLKPPERGGTDDGTSEKMLAQLQQRGQSRQAEVYAKFGVGGFGSSAGTATAASSSTTSSSAASDLASTIFGDSDA